MFVKYINKQQILMFMNKLFVADFLDTNINSVINSECTTTKSPAFVSYNNSESVLVSLAA